MHRLLAPLTLALLLLAPALALADIAPSGGCNRCSVEDEVGQGAALFALVGLAGALGLRRRGVLGARGD
ncbi:MYXO-CTERM sorting domain-containing protein [Enhygromyxa salina]|uniref:MYXO-CTERM sorting domain-containing protein n=1 Tax=Enhygromyxa salina TaxID=215803 RepID=UPI0011B213EB|nr:MYXO-CTERM sorting domain-containing protein [Enhygromyxa salina]